MTIKEAIVDKARACGYDFFSACEMADKAIAEFKASGLKSKVFGIMGAYGKCLDTFEIRRA